MIDLKFLRENPDLVKENIKKKFQDAKLPLVDEVLELDAKLRAAKIATEAGCEMVIANGSRPEVLYDIMDGRHVGTRFLTQEETR